MELLPAFGVYDNKYSFYECEAKTLLELAATLHGTMNRIIEENNGFSEEVNKIITEFVTEQTADREAFETAMHQAFQDFIDVVDLKLRGSEKMIEEYMNSIDAKIAGYDQDVKDALAGIDGAVDDAIADMTEAVDNMVNGAMDEMRAEFDEQDQKINDAIGYMQDNLDETINEALEGKGVSIGVDYDAATEAITISATVG